MNKGHLTLLLGLALTSHGCAFLPLPTKVVLGKKIQQIDLTFVQPGVTTRSEIVEKFGVPDKLFETPPVSVYWWLERRGYFVYGFPIIGEGLSGTPWVGDGGEINRTGLLLILFDQDDRARKVEIRYAPRSGVTESFIAKWVSTD